MSNNWDKINAVQRMQDYIMQHYNEEIILRDLAKAAAYSPWQALRAFSELTGKTPFAYIRDVRLTAAAEKLRDSDLSVLDIALSSAFGSHEGFTKAFSRQFGLSPKQYRKETPPIQLFTYYSIKDYYKSLEKGANNMSNTNSTNVVFTQVIERPLRKFIIKRGINATEYFAYCTEVDCDVWGILCSIKDVIHEPIGVWMPKGMRPSGTSEYCQGVEVPLDFTGSVPDGFDIIDLPECKYMIFHGEPYEDDERFGEAIGLVWDAISRYDPKHYGWAWAPDDGPRFQLAPMGYRGYIEGRPVREYKE